MGFWSAGLDQGLRSNPELPHHIRQKKHTSETRGKSFNISAVKKYTGVRYKCEYCPKTFTTVTDRDCHTSVHTGVYRFSLMSGVRQRIQQKRSFRQTLQITSLDFIDVMQGIQDK